ncbi:MAG: ATP-dependent Clp protease ATP-binding subunit ClpX [Lachnospiraceae bacterium]|nr:ATP-dependent Clp protease ATP-binding subunit ClpX [Lachnospiraceae bacterium]
MNGTNSGVAGNNGNTDTPDDAPDQEPDEKNPGRPGGIPLGNIFGGFPGGISFINLSDFQGEGPIPGRAKVKKKKKSDKPLIDLKKIPHPHEIKGMLDEYVIGQEHAKKALSVAVYNHYKRIATNTMNSIQIEKSNVLMIGPTGSGKTYLVQTLAKILDVPLAIADATSLTEAGYIGDDIESVVSKLLAAADNDIDRAEMGIVFIDEIDKIAKKKNTTSRDVSGESVQQGLLKLLEGAEVEVPVGANSKNAMVPLATVNTRNILFICGGAFPGLDEIIKQRLSKETGIGFGADLKDKFDKEKNLQLQATVEDVKKFGMIPEFVGRLPVLCPLESLTKEMLISILTEPKNAILRQYEKLLELDEVKLEFDESALEAIAEKAMKRDTGARALRAVIEEFMLDIMYEIPKDDNIGRVTITGDYINGTGGPLIEIRSNAHEPLLETSEPIPLEDKTMTAEGSEDEDAVS